MKIFNSSKSEQHLYSQGFCHVFALAMKELDNNMEFMVIRSYDEDYITDDDSVPCVLHVYTVKDNIAYDIFGTRPVSDVIEECKERFFDYSAYKDGNTTVMDLHDLISFEDEYGYHDNPLASYDKSDVEEAKKLIRSLILKENTKKTPTIKL